MGHHRQGSPLDEAGFVDDADGLLVPEHLDQELLQEAPGRIGIPLGAVQQALHAIRDRIAPS